MKKKLVSLLCIFAVTATMLTGCVHINIDLGDDNNDPIDLVDPDDDGDDDIDGTDVDDGDDDTDPTDLSIEAPDADTVLKFWADNYDDIAAGKYTPDDFDTLVYLSPIDLDGDMMPELIVQVTNDEDYYNTSYLLDVDPSLSKIVCVDKIDSKGSVVDEEIPYEPLMMYATPSGDSHYIIRHYENVGYETSGMIYTDICFRDDNDSYIAKPIVTRINERVEHYVVDGEETVLDYTQYYDGNGNLVPMPDFYEKYGMYAYSEKIGASSVYMVNYTPVFLYFGAGNLYNELKTAYENFTLTEKSIANPLDLLEGTWTIYTTSIEGDDELWDPSLGTMDITFYDGELCFYDFSRDRNRSYVDLFYYIEYTGAYFDEELWTLYADDFGDYEWISIRLHEDGLLYLSGIVRYNEYDYSSFYYGFRYVAD